MGFMNTNVEVPWKIWKLNQLGWGETCPLDQGKPPVPAHPLQCVGHHQWRWGPDCRPGAQRNSTAVCEWFRIKFFLQIHGVHVARKRVTYLMFPCVFLELGETWPCWIGIPILKTPSRPAHALPVYIVMICYGCPFPPILSSPRYP